MAAHAGSDPPSQRPVGTDGRVEARVEAQVEGAAAAALWERFA